MRASSSTTTSGALVQIGEVATRTGLSLRTIRHYEDVGLLPVTQRTAGGFRLYEQATIDRLLVIRQMKPLGFSLEEMGEVLGVYDRLAEPSALIEDERADLAEQLASYEQRVRAKTDDLRHRVAEAEAFARDLHDRQQMPD